MTFGVPAWMQRLRRVLSRSEWAARLLGVPRVEEEDGGRGLILIQIDGLGREQLEQALDEGRMPFLANLLETKEYELLSCYSGLPAATPAAQGELIYGVKTAVPSFHFRESETGKVVLAGVPTVASRIEERLAARGESLLKGGSSYGNTFAGGASKASFCSATLGPGEILRKGNPFSLLLVIVLHLFVAFRMAALLLAEGMLALLDALRGVVRRRGLFRELRFIPKRVALCVLLRELVALGARVDAARGVPVIACNFVSYDEQAHHRGPDSRLAFWTLRGIDRAIRGIFKAAERSDYREYDVWLYSDHGQESVAAFLSESGRSVYETVFQVFERHGVRCEETTVERPTEQLQRVILLGGRLVQRVLGVPGAPLRLPVTVAAIGPLAHAYPAEELPDYRKAEVAHDMVMTEGVPAVGCAMADGSAMLWTPGGSFRLPEEADALVGADHPFREELGEDLLRLIRHPDAGTFVLFGWRAGLHCLTFGADGGAHAGPGRRETHAFALLPRDVHIRRRDGGYIRLLDLREAALHHLGRMPPPAAAPLRGPKPPRRLRVMTYNVHNCVGLDGRHSPERIARVIARYTPDVVALQEVNPDAPRNGGADRLERIARELRTRYQAPLAVVAWGQEFGNAVLSRYPVGDVRTGPLPGANHRPPQGVLWVELDAAGTSVHLLNTHLALRPAVRFRQLDVLTGQQWLSSRDRTGPLLLCGDLNSQPGSRAYVRIARMLQDAQTAVDGEAHLPTWRHLRQVDHIFATRNVTVLKVSVPRTRLTRVASDHYPVVAEVELRRDGEN